MRMQLIHRMSMMQLHWKSRRFMKISWEINSEGEGKGTEAVIYIPVHEN